MSRYERRRNRSSHRQQQKLQQSGRSALPWIAGFAVLTVLLFVFVPAWLSRQAAIRNVLVVTMDSTGADALTCYGGPAAQTPSLDRIAREGVRFARCTTVTPVTLPSHCSIFTSTWPLVHGVRRDWGAKLGDAVETLAEVLGRAGFQTSAIVGSAVLRQISGLDQGFAAYTAVQASSDSHAATAGRPAKEVTDRAIDFLRGMRRQPFFLWANYHDPCLATFSVVAGTAAAPAGPDLAQAYSAAIRTMDTEIGRLVHALDSLQLGSRTLVVITGAHGEDLAAHGEKGHGCFLYESTLHVPLILRCPSKILKNRVIEDRVQTIDLMPTVLDYLRQMAAPAAQGRSLRPLILKATTGEPPAAFAETDVPSEVFGLASLRSLTADKWKYIDSPDPELYNLAQDPGETKNLAAERPDEVTAMRKRLAAAVNAATRTLAGGNRGITPSAEDLELLSSITHIGKSGGPATGSDRDSTDRTKAPRAHVEAIGRYADAWRLVMNARYAEAEAPLRAVLADLPEAPYPLRDLRLVLEELGGATRAVPQGAAGAR